MRYVVTATIVVETDGTEADALDAVGSLLPVGQRVRDGAVITARLTTITYATATARVHRNLLTDAASSVAKLGGA